MDCEGVSPGFLQADDTGSMCSCVCACDDAAAAESWFGRVSEGKGETAETVIERLYFKVDLALLLFSPLLVCFVLVFEEDPSTR